MPTSSSVPKQSKPMEGDLSQDTLHFRSSGLAKPNPEGPLVPSKEVLRPLFTPKSNPQKVPRDPLNKEQPETFYVPVKRSSQKVTEVLLIREVSFNFFGCWKVIAWLLLQRALCEQ